MISPRTFNQKEDVGLVTVEESQRRNQTKEELDGHCEITPGKLSETGNEMLQEDYTLQGERVS